jgi:excisionase family DNA binding protein
VRPLKSVVESAELLRISPWTIRSYIRDGKLKPVRLGRRVLVEETELERFIASGKPPFRDAEHRHDAVMGVSEEKEGGDNA